MEDQLISDVSLSDPSVRRFVGWVHGFLVVGVVLPSIGGWLEMVRIQTTEKAIRWFITGVGGPDGLAVCDEAGLGGFALWGLLTSIRGGV